MFDLMLHADVATSAPDPLRGVSLRARKRPMALFTADGRYRQGNPAFLALFDARHGELVGRRASEIGAAPRRGRPVDWRLIGMGVPITEESRRRIAGGREIAMLEAYAPLLDRTGAVSDVIAVFFPAGSGPAAYRRPQIEVDGCVIG